MDEVTATALKKNKTGTTCEKHGLPEYTLTSPITNSVIPSPTMCDLCWEEHDRRVTADEEPEIKPKKTATLPGNLTRAIPPRFAGASSTSLREGQKEAWATIAPALDADFVAALLVGANRVGKSFLGWRLCERASDRGLSWCRTTLRRLCREVKESWRSGSESAVIERHASPDILIVDEINRGFGSETELQILTEILDVRHDYLKPYVLLTDATPEEAAEAVGRAVVKRIAEESGMTEVKA